MTLNVDWRIVTKVGVIFTVIVSFACRVLPSSCGPSVTGGNTCNNGLQFCTLGGEVYFACGGFNCPAGTRYPNCATPGPANGQCNNAPLDLTCNGQNSACFQPLGFGPACTCQ